MERFYRRRLPHYRVEAAGAAYFVTWRLETGQPALDEGEKDAVVAALRHWDLVRCRLFAFVVMDDHVHLLVTLLAGTVLERLLQSWKGFTATRLIRQFGRHGGVWQHESYDRVVRNDEEFRRLADYIAANPRRRWPENDGYRWVWIAAGEGGASPHT